MPRTSQGTTTAPKSKLRRWREAKGWSGREMADLTGLDETFLSRLERGERTIGAQGKIALARALGCRVRDIFDVDEPVPAEEVASR